MESALSASGTGHRVPRTRRFKHKRYVVAFLVLIFPYTDNLCGNSLRAIPFLALGFGIAILLVALHALSASPAQRRKAANGTLLFLLAFLLWLDAGPVIMAARLMDGTWWDGYAAFAVIATPLLFLASGWRRGEFLPTLARIGILLGATALIPSIQWNFRKGDALLMRSVLHQPLAVVQREMDGEYVTLILDEENRDERLEGVVGENLDLVDLHPDAIWTMAFGTGVLTLEDGVVSSVWFLYD